MDFRGCSNYAKQEVYGDIPWLPSSAVEEPAFRLALTVHKQRGFQPRLSVGYTNYGIA